MPTISEGTQRHWISWRGLWLRTGLAATAAACAVAAGVHFMHQESDRAREIHPPAALAIDPSEWHDATRTEQALGATDSLVLTAPDGAKAN